MSHDSPSPDDFMAQAPADPSGNTPWAQRYGRDLRGVVRRYAARMPRSVQRHLGPSELGYECLTGDTLVVTRDGLKPLASLEGKTAELLVPMLYKGSDVRKRWGKFVKAPVTCYGEREVYEVRLASSYGEKVVRATGDHRWFRQYWSGKQRKQERLTTAELRPGQHLTSLQAAMPHSPSLMGVAVAQGFTFGDGTRVGNRPDGRVKPDVISIYANHKDEALLKFFLPDAVREVKHEDADRQVQCSHMVGPLPKHWKNLPDIRESRDFLLSWLAGYFAADGSVGRDDGHCSISSADKEHLEFVRDVAAVCGVEYSLVTKAMRVGISGTKPAPEATALYKLTLNRRDLPAWFFLIEEHACRVAKANLRASRPVQWTVTSVIPAGREKVYCPTVVGPAAFALADNLMTGNCDRMLIGKMAGVHIAPHTNNVGDPWASIMGTAMHAFLEEAFSWENGQLPAQRWLTESRVIPDPDAVQPHPGTADLYDLETFSLVDHKGQSEGMRGKLRTQGPPRHYYVQMLLYGLGYLRLGYRVDRVVLVSWPRTKSTMDDMYVWEHPLGPEDFKLMKDTLDKTAVREQLAEGLRTGQFGLMDIPATPSDDACHYCPFYRPQVATAGGYGCPGTLLRKVS